MPHKVYKNCPMVLKLLWKLMRIAWKSQAIPSEYSQAVATFTPQEATTSWYQLGKGIAMGCSTSPILSTTAFNHSLQHPAHRVTVNYIPQLFPGWTTLTFDSILM